MKTILAIVLLAAGLTLTGCRAQFSSTESGTNVSDELPPPDPHSVVCEPFDEGQNGSSIYGLSGNLFYIPRSEAEISPGEPRYTSVNDYITPARQFDDYVLYMSRLYVPTRPFDRGFVTQTGETLKVGGEALYEYFGVSMNSRIRLHTGDPEGPYQFAVLSDDGSIFTLGNPADPTLVLNNDGVSPTRMGCSATPVQMTKKSKIPMRMDYFQGPRFHISLILLWRPFPTDPNEVNDPLCGHASNEDYFDSTQDPPVAQWAYNELLSRGWRPLLMENYLIQDGINPCNEDF